MPHVAIPDDYQGVALEAVRAGRWVATLGVSLEDKVLGVLGLGKLGAGVAAVGVAFGMQVIAWSQNLTADTAAACGATLVTKDELFSHSDIVTIHVQLSERTRGLVGTSELCLMQPTAYLVNTARGPIVDESALVHALQTRAIAGAGLDVFAQEPLPPNHRAPTCITTRGSLWCDGALTQPNQLERQASQRLRS